MSTNKIYILNFKDVDMMPIYNVDYDVDYDVYWINLLVKQI